MQGSPFAQLFADERLHKNLPGRRGVARVIWRWACNSLSGGIESLIREYDADLVPNEGLLRYDATSKRLMPVQERLSLNSKSDRAPRALLVIHGLLSNTEAVIDDLKGRWLDGMSSRYAAILGLDHRTLSKDPEQNAVELFEMLKRYAPELVRDQRLDVVTHSRGGLVARAFCELEGHAAAVRNLVMVGTPNCGTDLANSKNWGRLADSLVNLSGIAQAKPIGYLAGFLARLAVMGVQTAAPGLMAMNPETAGVKNKFLSRLQQADRKNLTVRYSAVTADFEPTPIIPNLKSLVATAKSMGIDTATDSFFGKDGEPVANDLVVNTAHVWCVGQSAAEKQNLPKSFGKRVLAFVPPDSPAELPSGVRREVELGVNHFNLLANPTTQDAIRKWLSEL